MKVEQINPYKADSRDKSEQVREMFDTIAPAYDLMNRAMTFGIDRIWRRKAVGMISSPEPSRILDIATGTGDLALRMAESFPSALITGVDLSEKMVAIGCEKVRSRGLEERVKLLTGDCLDLPFGDDSFDCITCAYGVRNFQDLLAGYREMLRVLRPGGRVMILELSVPECRLVKPFYRLYTRAIIPLAGRIVSKDVRAYSYLPESIAAVPSRAQMTAIMEEAGFSNAACRELTFGVCCIYTAVKPPVPEI